MNDLKISGKVLKVHGREQKTETFTMRQFVIETDGRYPQPVQFQLTQDRCDLVDDIDIGEEVTVYFDIRGNEWNGKIINNLNVWKIIRGNGAAPYRSEPPVNTNANDGVPF